MVEHERDGAMGLCVTGTVKILLLQKQQMGNILATTRIKHSIFPGCPEYPYANAGYGVLGKRILR